MCFDIFSVFLLAGFSLSYAFILTLLATNSNVEWAMHDKASMVKHGKPVPGRVKIVLIGCPCEWEIMCRVTPPEEFQN
jgi:hypothetical protein